MNFVAIRENKFTLEGRGLRLKGINYSDPDSPWLWFRKWNLQATHRGLAEVAGLGVNCVHMWVPNSFEEVDPHGLDSLALIDEFLHAAELNDIRCYVGLRWQHKWAERGSLGDKANLDYLGVLVDMLKDDPRVVAWDIMNEPDHVSHECWQWNMDPPQAERRLLWLKRMCDAVKEADPIHPVSIGATFSRSYWQPDGALSLQSMVDVVDFHYYRANYRESTLAEEIRAVREHTDKPIVIGEFGFSSCPKCTIHGEPEHSEELQEAMYDEYLSDCESENVAGLLPWVLTDYREEFESGESAFGLLRADYTRKPAAALYASRFRVSDQSEAPAPGSVTMRPMPVG